MAIVDSNSIRMPSALNKYRGILIAVTLFLLFNLSIFGLNFYTSSTLDNDAVSIFLVVNGCCRNVQLKHSWPSK